MFPGSLGFLIDFSKQFKPLIEVNEYTDLFNTVILGLGITFELPILIMFLSLFGIVSPRFLWKNVRYAILIIFIIAAIITPTPDVLTMSSSPARCWCLPDQTFGVSFLVSSSAAPGQGSGCSEVMRKASGISGWKAG